MSDPRIHGLSKMQWQLELDRWIQVGTEEIDSAFLELQGVHRRIAGHVGVLAQTLVMAGQEAAPMVGTGHEHRSASKWLSTT